MLLADFKLKLEETGLPLAYRFFAEGEAPSLPYICYYAGGENNFSADGENYVNIKQMTVELYTELKDPTVERKVEEALKFTVWSKTEEYIDSEKCYQIVYYMEVL